VVVSGVVKSCSICSGGIERTDVNISVDCAVIGVSAVENDIMGVVQNAVSQHFARVRSAHGQ
jgi:hypothetical protein